jgi:putative PIN family toxin of toxin-antitoxin system
MTAVMKVVIDTNVLVSSLSSKSVYHWIIEALFNERFELYVTDEILFEYEEILRLKYSEKVANNFMLALQELPNVHYAQVYFRWNLIKDEDDNKFVDCYVAAGSSYLLSNDSPFSVLKKIQFSKVNIINIDEFKIALSNYK